MGMDGMTYPSVVQWYEQNSESYKDIESRLSQVNDRFMSEDVNVATKMLHDSYLNSLMSMQTPVVRHEYAWQSYMSGESDIQEALGMTLYGNQKHDWYQSNDWSDFQKVTELLQSGETDSAYDELVNIKGLSYKKASFTLAMLGFTTFMCIDSNVQKLVGFTDSQVSTRSKDKYMSLCDNIMWRYSHLDMSPFMTQWVLFDYNMGVNNTHDVWFNHMM